eukprot:gene7419-11742_t
MLRNSLKRLTKPSNFKNYYAKLTREEEKKIQEEIQEEVAKETEKMINMARNQEYSEKFGERELRQLELKLQQYEKLHSETPQKPTQILNVILLVLIFSIYYSKYRDHLLLKMTEDLLEDTTTTLGEEILKLKGENEELKKKIAGSK